VKNQSIARRYAKALLMIGKTDGMADNYKDELNGFASLIAKEMALEQVINNPLYNAKERKKSTVGPYCKIESIQGYGILLEASL